MSRLASTQLGAKDDLELLNLCLPSSVITAMSRMLYGWLTDNFDTCFSFLTAMFEIKQN